ncbi:PREDICTED: shikimate O-hydroxycinnamoyltransferase-like [Fragaria vesca subsp. vesca]|uniref:shikimate O-hydroxycinnamoyltransferase-like n=1 Tax=Fragaria vesca subsp. vesca TaxID=101020 RepID=UPI0002C32168|nr:PREDICTED: shikimate O-hydroxycinnamoyltransferase-like [Fragaria vesca subsp. vesca]
MQVGGREFEVTTRKQEVVAAALPLQEHWLPLSNLDLLLPPVDVGVFFCYKNHTSPSAAAARFGVLKKALTQALVAYYAFSGEVVTNSFGEPEILCNNRGVGFVEAFADVELKELNLYNPDESIEGKFVPNKKRGVLAVQATELKCGGMVVACTFDHRVADAYSANMFLVSWAKMANSKSPVPEDVPSFRRSLLNPRRPCQIHPSLNDMYVPVTSLPPPKMETNDHEDQLANRIYYVKAEQLIKLQALASSNGCKRSKLESFCAFLWKMVAGSETGNDVEKLCKMGIVVDGRSRLADENKMASYFGNVLSIPFGGKVIQELNEKSLNWVADEVHEFLECAVTKEHFLGLIDWVEAHRPVPGLAKIYCSGSEEGPAFVVSSGQRFPVSEVDFGWGAPLFGSYHFPWGGSSGYVMPMPSPVGNGDWVVYMHMLKGQLDVIEKEGGHVFKPLTYDYLV